MQRRTGIMVLPLLVFHLVTPGLVFADENYGIAAGYIVGDQSEQVSRAIRGKGEVWVVVAGGDRFKIRNPRAVSSGLQYGRGDTGGEIPWQQLRAIQIRSNQAGKGALYGGLVLGLSGLAVGGAATKECSGGLRDLGTLCGADTGDMLLLTAIGTGIGAFLGAAIGGMMSSDKTIYRSAGFIGLRPVIDSQGGKPTFGMEVRLAPGP